jgi:hypothetical protein
MEVLNARTVLFVYSWRHPLAILVALGGSIVALLIFLMWPWSWTFDRMLSVFLLGFFVYLLMATLVNRSTVRLSPAGLVVKNSPLPWPGNRTMPLGDISYVRWQKYKFSKGRRYRVEVMLVSGRERQILPSFSDGEEAQKIADAIQQQLRALKAKLEANGSIAATHPVSPEDE